MKPTIHDLELAYSEMKTAGSYTFRWPVPNVEVWNPNTSNWVMETVVDQTTGKVVAELQAWACDELGIVTWREHIYEVNNPEGADFPPHLNKWTTDYAPGSHSALMRDCIARMDKLIELALTFVRPSDTRTDEQAIADYAKEHEAQS